MHDQWVEPFANIIGGFEFMVPSLVGHAVKNGLLSERLLVHVLQLSQNEDSQWFLQEVDLRDGVSEQLLPLLVRLMEKSYELACTKFDEPQLAILAVHVLCTICLRAPRTSDSLARLSRVNELAASRVARHSIGVGMPFEVQDDVLESLLLDWLGDFRILVKRHHTHIADILVGNVPAFAPHLQAIGETAQNAVELIYLLAEHGLAKGDYWYVINIPQVLDNVWQMYLDDRSSLEILARRVKLCIAKAMEATGQLSEARELYAECGIQELDDLDACLAGTQMYVSVRRIVPIKGIDFLAPRELCDGKIALLFRQSGNSHCGFKFNTFDPVSNALTECQLPHEGKKWRAVLAIPDPPSQPLRVLVAPKSAEAGEDAITELMTEMMGGMFPASMAQNNRQTLERVELWEYRQFEWHEIMTRGCIPDRLVVTRVGAGCAILDNKLVVFRRFRIRLFQKVWLQQRIFCRGLHSRS